MAHKMHEEKSDQTIKKAFEAFDADKSGFIDRTSGARILANLGEAVTSQQVSAMISRSTRMAMATSTTRSLRRAPPRRPRRACAPPPHRRALPTQVLVEEESTRFEEEEGRRQVGSTSLRAERIRCVLVHLQHC